jgi:ABC-type nitrate/sulfonate/bicarbonate transport system permease component
MAVLWQIAKDTGVITSTFLPAPTQILRAAGDLISAGTLITDVWHTLYVALAGWTIAGVLGVAIGVVLGLGESLWRYSMASIEFLRALPGIAFVPVAVLILGFSAKTELVIVVYVSIWPVLVNAIHGVRSVTPVHDDLARMLRMGRASRIRRLVLPTAMPFVLVGLQFSLALALALALVAEMIGNPAGIGHGLIMAQNTLQPAEMFAYVVTVGLLGLALNAIYLQVSARLFPVAASGMGTGP